MWGLSGGCSVRMQSGHRGSQSVSARAMARRIVMKESAKCRSGRERVRVSATSPSGLGGEMPHTLRDDEGVAAECDRDVVMPARKRSSLEVVEAELALH